MSAAGNLPTITVPIVGDVSGLLSAFNKVQVATKSLGNNVAAKLVPIRAGINAVGAAAMKFVAPIAAAATAFAGFAAVMDAFERNETLGKTAAALGMTVDALARLNYVAELTASSAGAMGLALVKMEKFLGDATAGSEQAVEILTGLGLTVKGLAGLKPEEAFGVMADAMNRLDDQGRRTSAMMTVFGDGGRDITQVVQLGSVGIAKMGKEAEELGRVTSKIDFARIDVAKGYIENLSVAFKALSTNITSVFGPMIGWLASGINAWVGDTKRFNNTFSKMADNVLVAVGLIRTAFHGVSVMWNLASGSFAALGSVMVKIIHNVIYVAKGLGDAFGKVWDWITASFEAFKNVLAVGMSWVVEKINTAISTIGETFGEMMRDMGMMMVRSGVKGLVEGGDALASAGASLIVGSVKMRSGSGQILEEAKKGLDQSLDALAVARNAANTPMAKPITGLEDAVYALEKFQTDAAAAINETIDTVQQMPAGSIMGDTFSSYLAFVDQFNKDVAAKVEEGNAAVAVINAAHASEEEGSLIESNDRRALSLAEHYANVLKSTQDANDELAFITSASEEIQAARQEEFNIQRALNEQKHLDNLLMLWRSGAMGKMQALGGILDNLQVLMQSKNKALFNIGKVAALAQNTIDTIAGAASSWKFGAALGGPAVGAAFAATAVMAGLVRAQQIMAAQPNGSGGIGSGGGGGGSSGAGAASATQQAAAAERRNVNVTLYGDNFSGTQVRGLIAAINEQTGDNMSLKAQVSK